MGIGKLGAVCVAALCAGDGGQCERDAHERRGWGMREGDCSVVVFGSFGFTEGLGEAELDGKSLIGGKNYFQSSTDAG